MRLAVLTPIGPSHEGEKANCKESSEVAWKTCPGPFTEMRHFFLDDVDGWHGRAFARNVLLRRAKSWGADWVISLDATDIIYPAAFRRIGEAMEAHPEAQTIMGCLSLWFAPADVRKYELRDQFYYRSPYDICPLPFETLLREVNMGTIGTQSCVRMDLAWKLGFRCDLPAAEYFEFSTSCFANAPYVKIPHPIVVVDRSCGHAESNTDPFVHQGSRLDGALKAICEVWSERGRVPYTYDELEERWESRWTRTEDLFEESFFGDVVDNRHAYAKELD